MLLVLWMLTLLTAIAGSMVFASRADVLAAGNLRSLAEAEAIADAGVQRAVFDLLTPSPDPRRWKGDGDVHAWPFAGGRTRIAIIDESAKVDLNAAPVLLLKGLFQAAGATDPEALADAVVDWRDADDLRGPNGAESQDYLAAARDDGPANAPFESIDDLRRVLGMNETLFRRLEPLVTVHSQQPGVNGTIAPRGVLLALPGTTPEMVDGYLEQRRLVLAQGLPAPAFGPAQQFPSRTSGAVFTVQVAVELGDNTRFFREAVIRLTGDRKVPAINLAWRSPVGFGGSMDLN